MLAQTFVSEEPEGTVPAVIDSRQVDRTAGGSAEFVTNQAGGGVAVLPGARAQSGGVVAEGFKHTAVQLVGPALGRQRDGGRTRVTRARAVGLDAKLLHRVEAGLHGVDAAAETVDDGDAILQHLHRADFEAVDARRAPTLDTG